ncbi:flagellar biosynthesis anti-sigma factor FlgM [Halalkalibacillus halophilus]|uniref:flagellar biosynthesis anti-sigma factor FlgM n=1 Tax=Halalkalibacillus halophilus TaxID=392827 RepID=UPI000421006A|nr:flagellar biosynthesis anti-sigma factor FlgM [Halalkalibacillus halophilus]
MKINPTNGAHLNPYQKQVQNQQNVQKQAGVSDKIEISSKAKEMQQGNGIEQARQEKVSALKQQVQHGDYDMDLKQTAEKMVDFWSNRRG